MYAVFEDGSRQYRVSEGDQVDVDFREADVGKQIEFDRVLLYSGSDGVRVGTPPWPMPRWWPKCSNNCAGRRSTCRSSSAARTTIAEPATAKP